MMVADLAQLSHNGQVYRAFGMAVVADYGLLAMMPLPDVAGRLTTLVDGCPVAWEEAFAVLSHSTDEPIGDYIHQLNEQAITTLAQYSEPDAVVCEWTCSVMDEHSTFVFIHHSGLRIAMDAYRALTPDAFQSQKI